MKNLLLILALILLISGCSQSTKQYTQLYSNGDSDWLSFSINNRQGTDFTYSYELLGVNQNLSTVLYASTLRIGKDQTGILYLPKQKEFETVVLRLNNIAEEISIHTGYVPPEERPAWKPEIVEGLKWEEQDPLVQHYYKYVTSAPTQDARHQ